MSQPNSQPSLKIFISYRRADSGGYALHLFDKLTAHFGKEQIFMDIDRIEPGEDFVQVIQTAVGSCDVLIALIGRQWLTITDGDARRLDNPNDFVRLEIAAALARSIRVIPVLVQGAQMPRPQDLPEDLLSLSRRQAHELSDQRSRHDIDQLISTLEKILARQREAQRIAAQEEAERRKREAEEAKRSKRELEQSDQRSVAKREQKQQSNEPSAETAATQPSSVKTSQPPQVVKNSIGMEFVWIPPGSFMMGSEKGRDDEKPVHHVTINEGFYMGKYEVTQAQWQAVMGDNPSYFKGCDNCPVENVSWDDAQVFINKLNTQNDGYTYRLPTEAEWEYAARAGTTGDYAGDLDAMAWYEKNSGGETHSVGSKQANAFGLYDIHGNVWEWVEDWYHDSYAGAPRDGSAWLSGGKQKYRVLRGGSWVIYANLCRAAVRIRNLPVFRNFNFGFRVVAVVRA
jgi:formylglycine-generating enzyme required for sulfatase activity